MRRIQGMALFAFIAAGCTGTEVPLVSTVSTVAGTGADAGSPGRDGPGTTATFNHPYSVALGPDGSLYVADTYNNKIRKIAMATNGTSTVTTYAGTGTASLTDGDCAVATFNYPTSLAVDSDGTVYVADRANTAVRKIMAGPCVVRTLAGGVDVASPFSGPTGLTVDASGNVYVTDYKDNQIFKVSPAGDVTLLAGIGGKSGNTDGTTDIATFSAPVGIAVDGAGYLYVADLNNKDIRKITPEKTVSTLAGSPGVSGLTDGTGALATFNAPYGLAMGADNSLYVADRDNHAIRKVSPTGDVTTIAGTGATGADDGSVETATFNQPNGLAVDAAGVIYVADAANNKIRKITLVR